ncbi:MULTISPECIES: ABC transporter permease subunit [unclassified Schaalia]|uniref:ABC transporter permease subunit n=1 Tax=unclassified Schaalia TaxID=2691889 RepID=UPI001E33D11C|nr:MULTISPECIES: sugar ABC transporter permease [unclassified Schaalia]MCD4550233.1 sugar ABC transporter permease [Schaalia sp. lx-260]MCD4558147.1 sugar ABC transporter permease [Schaalia sp. lx-100]
MKKNMKELFGGDFRQFGMIAALITIALYFQWTTDGKVFQAQNLMNLVLGNTYVLVLAIGMVLVIIAGHIDLSVGSVAATVGIVVAVVMRDYGVHPWLAIIIGLLLGILIGAWQGFWVAKWGIPAFIVTLAGMLLFRGMNQFIGHSLTVPVPELFQTLGAGYLPDIAPEVIPFNLPTMILAVLAASAVVIAELRSHKRKSELAHTPVPLWIPLMRAVVISIVIIAFGWIFATGREGTSFPIPGVIVVVLALVYSFIAERTILGRSVYAIGGNKAAAELTGVKVVKTNFFVICNSAFLAAIAGILFIGRSTASGPADGNMWELDAIAAVFIGGAAVSGGIGTIGGTMVGALVMAFLNNGLQLLGVGSDKTQMIKGLVLLIAVALDVYSKRQGRRSIIGTFMNARARQQEKTTDQAMKTSA